MRAAAMKNWELRVDDIEDPVPGAGQVLTRVLACGICGSDLHVAGMVGAPGTILGHEITGTVEAHGPKADAGRWPTGTPVVARPFAGCGRCRWCESDRPDHCEHFALIGLEHPGGFAEINGERIDVISEGEMIPQQTPIIVVNVEGNRVIVETQESAPRGGR